MGSFLSSQSQPPPPCPSVDPAQSPAATATAVTTTVTADPRWMLLKPYGGGQGKACNITGDSTTIAAAATSNGHRISVSLRRDPFSVLSRLCLCFLPGAADTAAACSTVIAAHNGSVLVRITSREDRYWAPCAYDYFVYNNAGCSAAAAAADDPARPPPPSLHLLPGCDQWRWRLDVTATGFLSHAEAEFVVAQLKTLWVMGDKTPNKAAELLVFRHGKWCVKQRRIFHGHGKKGDRFLAWWEPHTVVPLGDRRLCWVDFFCGVIFSDDLLDDDDDKGAELRYVPFPAKALKQLEHFVCTNARGAVKLVAVSPRRCSQCGCSEHATATDTWTWKLEPDAMAWVLETETNIVDSAELWALPCNPGYARVHLVYPVASMNNGGDPIVGGGHVASEESTVRMDEKDEHHLSLCVISTPSATAELRDGLQGDNGATSPSTHGQRRRQGEDATGTVGRWPKRRRRANSMVIGPEWIA